MTDKFAWMIEKSESYDRQARAFNRIAERASRSYYEGKADAYIELYEILKAQK